MLAETCDGRVDRKHPYHPVAWHLPIFQRWEAHLARLENDARRHEELAHLAQQVLGMKYNLHAVSLMEELCTTPVRDGYPRGWESVMKAILGCADCEITGDKEAYLVKTLANIEQRAQDRRTAARPQSKGAQVLAKAEAEASATMRDPQYQWLNREKPAWWKD